MSISGFCALIHKTLVFVALESNQSTLSDIVSTVEHLHKQRCGCALSTGSDAWVKDSIEELNRDDISECSPSSDSGFFSSGGSSSSHERRYLGVGDCIRDLRRPVVFTATHGKPSTPPNIPGRCCPTGCRHGPGRLGNTRIMQTCPGSPMCLPEPSTHKLFSFACVPGMVFVDKTAVIDFLYERFQQSKLPLVRRPAGFGKTVFLSTVARYHDYNGPALTKCLLGQTACWTPNAPQPNQHLVLYFDFSEVPVGPTFKDDFERYLLRMVLSFVDTYDDVLNISADIKSTFDEFDILHYILTLVAYRHHTVFLAVDNYNAIQLKAWSIDDADELDGEFALMVDESIDRAFCRPVEGAIYSVIRDGLIVGTSDCGYADPIGVFSGMCYDMTYKAPLRSTFGFTEEEVEQLAKLFCQPNDFLEEVRRDKKVGRFSEIRTARREKRVLGYDPRTRHWCTEDYEMMEADGINFEEEDNKEASEDSDDESSDDETEADDISGVCVYSMTDVLNLLRERIKAAELRMALL